MLDQLMEQFAATRRHFDVVAERFESNQRLLAESIAGVSASVERLEDELRREVSGGFSEMRSMIRLSYSELERRMEWLEGSLSDLRSRVEKLERAA